MTTKQKAEKARLLMTSLDRSLKRAEQARNELCALLCGTVEQYGAEHGLTPEDVAGIIAPKDD